MAEQLTDADVARIGRIAASIGPYHQERAGFGGLGREFHERAAAFMFSDVPALLVDIAALRARLAATERELDEWRAVDRDRKSG